MYELFGKRIIDILTSALALIILAPFFLIIALLIKLDSKGPVIYRQKRVGKGAKEFYIYKFRTMVVDADRIGPKSTSQGDRRITKLGSTLRKLSLDELPQLINVLAGKMSIVGYRPGVAEDYSDFDMQNSSIFTVKPGITGYAQVNGRSSNTLQEKRYWEQKYIEDISFFTDVKIILETIKVVILKRGTN